MGMIVDNPISGNSSSSNIKYFVSGTVDNHYKLLYECETHKEAKIIQRRLRILKARNICLFKNTNRPYKLKNKELNLMVYNKELIPDTYKDFCSCCGRDF